MSDYQTTPTRCWGEGHPLLQPYHDTEWGVPLYEDRALFEFLVLEGMQAGLSWLTVLRKREAFRRAFHGFEPARVARYTRRDLARLLRDPGIIRNRQKLDAAVANARAFLDVQREYGGFHRFLWSFVGHRPIRNAWRTLRELPVTTPASNAMSRGLKAHGFRFVGPTICYAHMQATGMVNDHLVGCFRYRQVGGREAMRLAMNQSRALKEG